MIEIFFIPIIIDRMPMIHKIQFFKVLALKDLRSYIQTVCAWKMLSLQEERFLARKVYYHADLIAAKIIILSNLKFVVHISRNYLGYGLSQADLIQEGNIGLIKAIRRFNPNINVRIISFAIYWIKSEMHEYILKNWKIVKIATTKPQRKLFFNLRKIKKKSAWFTNDELNNISHQLGVKKVEVQEMESRMFSKDINLFPMVECQKEDYIINNITSYLKDYKSDFAKQYEKDDFIKHIFHKLHSAMLNLDSRSRYIIYSRWLNNNHQSTLQEIAQYYGISAERVRQIEKDAMKKLKLFFKD